MMRRFTLLVAAMAIIAYSIPCTQGTPAGDDDIVIVLMGDVALNGGIAKAYRVRRGILSVRKDDAAS
ncbi:MAG: hypothetical protein CVT48_03525 [Thermoplasmata archaeon HGW-Thermoplasmata-1]|nr:MAG: hypothetical protein CVT48_03525 [Thermoplasmata archaeon HGW-Thermoplasmata-1]